MRTLIKHGLIVDGNRKRENIKNITRFKRRS